MKRDPFLDLSVSIPERFTNVKSKSQQRENPCKLQGDSSFILYNLYHRLSECIYRIGIS